MSKLLEDHEKLECIREANRILLGEELGDRQTLVDICLEFVNDMAEMSRERRRMARALGISNERNHHMCFADMEILYRIRWFLPGYWVTKLFGPESKAVSLVQFIEELYMKHQSQMGVLTLALFVFSIAAIIGSIYLKSLAVPGTIGLTVSILGLMVTVVHSCLGPPDE